MLPIVRPFAYPDSDGKRLSENTLQLEWIFRLFFNLDAQYADRPDVFVAADNLIYPEMGKYDVRQAPDVYVAFGVPKGHRGSYKVWEENGVFPQVVFEILSQGNRPKEMRRKFRFYQKYGVEEYYIYDPARDKFKVYVRSGDKLRAVRNTRSAAFVSPRLGVRFVRAGGELRVFGPDGRQFPNHLEFARARATAEEARRAADEARVATEQKAATLAEKLRSLGVDPDTV